MEQIDSYLYQALSTTCLITELANNDYLSSDHFNKIKFTNKQYKEIIKQSGLGNPATLQMFLYALLVVPYSYKENKHFDINFSELNPFINNITIDSYSNYEKDKDGIDYIRHLRNAVSHSKCNYYVDCNNICMVEFYDSDNTHKCYFKMKTSDVGLLLEKIQKIIIKYLDNKLTNNLDGKI